MSTDRLQRIGLLAVLTLASVAVSHHLIYLASYGPGGDYARAMSQTGHDQYWADFLIVVGGALLITVVAAVRQLRRLTRLASSGRVGRTPDRGLRALVRTFLSLALRLSLFTLATFLIQENAEILSVDGRLPGLEVVTGHGMAAMPIMVLVAAVIAFVRALAEWRRDILLARLRASSVGRHLAPRVRPATGAMRLISTLHLDSHGQRAPPARVAALV